MIKCTRCGEETRIEPIGFTIDGSQKIYSCLECQERLAGLLPFVRFLDSVFYVRAVVDGLP